MPILADSTSSDAHSSSHELATQVKGIPLSRLLTGVVAAVARAFSEGISGSIPAAAAVCFCLLLRRTKRADVFKQSHDKLA